MNLNTTNWQRAVDRAMAYGCEDRVTYRGSGHVAGGIESVFTVESSTGEGAYTVTVTDDRRGKVETFCTCPAGQAGKHACWHAAAALLIRGHLVIGHELLAA